MYLEPLGVMEE